MEKVMDQKIYFYNTVTRKKEEFKPIFAKPDGTGEVGIYSCGPTVYWDQHVGNMYAFLFDDILSRTLRYFGYKVKWVMNITDVGHLTDDADAGEDKMEKGAKRENLSVWEVASKYEKQFRESLKLLNIEMPEVMPKATDHISEQIELIKKIEKNGFVYQTSDGIYFDTSKFKGYADFANLDLEKIREGARVEVNSEKRNPADFALWKFSPKNGPKRQMEWESPWGVGFPGWHIECSAMSTKYLGDRFDIHTGGEDHIPVHHTNEIAQGFGGLGQMTANYWMHNAFITLKGGKMSKSDGKIITIQELVAMGFDPLDYRFLVLGSHYKKGIDFSIEALERARNSRNKLIDAVKKWEKIDKKGKINTDVIFNFKQKLANDLAMPEVMAVVWKLVKSDLSEGDKYATILEIDKVLGLNLKGKSEESDEKIPKVILKLAEDRQKSRENLDWAESDRIRDLLKKKGFVVEDVKDGGYQVKKNKLL
jgi:cysteinyl-tRNA synthetase